MSALENIRKGLSSSGSTLIVGILIVGLVATFGNFLGTDNAFSNQKVLEINGQDISIQEFSLEANRLNSIFSNQEISLEQDQVTQIAQDSLIKRNPTYLNFKNIDCLSVTDINPLASRRLKVWLALIQSS